jgi:pimeloyl-ACP methyl ester carboxylesterase
VSPDGIDHFKVVAAKIGEMAAAEPHLVVAELAIVPGTSHFLTQAKPDLVNRIVVDFLTRAGPDGRRDPPRPKPEASPG